MLDLVITTLEELINVQKQLISYADDKKEVLITRKVDELNQIVQAEAKLVKQLSQLESERQQQVENVLQMHPSLTFIQFIDAFSDEDRQKKLTVQLKTLQQLMVELQSKNKVNEQLLKDSLSFVHHMINQVTDSKQQQFNYQSPLRQQPSQLNGRGFFDTKA